MLWSKQIRQRLRSLAKTPAFSLGALLTIALGIGVNAGILALTHATLLRPLPWKEAQRLAFVYANFKGSGFYGVSYPDITDWAEQNHMFDQLAAYADWRNLTLTGTEEPLRVHANFVSADYFEVLGAQAMLGRTFQPEETQFPGAHRVVLLSHGLWQRHFGGDRDILERSVNLNDIGFAVIGVLSPDFHDLAENDHRTDVWVPLGSSADLFGPHTLERRTARWMFGAAKLKPGVTLQQAQADMDGVAMRLTQEYPDTNQDFGATVDPLKKYFFGEVRGEILLLQVGAGLVLLLVCVNLANLMLARATDREREWAVHAALGAGRLRLALNVLAEPLVLCLAGGGLGVLLAVWGMDLLVTLSPVSLPEFVNLALEGQVLGATLLLSLLVSLLIGLPPALRATRMNVQSALREGRGGHGNRPRGRVRSLLVIGEVALALTLLIGAGLMARSFQRLGSGGPGFRTENTLTLKVELSSSKYSEDDAKVRFAERFLEKAQNLPGVEAAWTWAEQMPGLARRYINLIPEDHWPAESDEMIQGYRHYVSPGAVRQLGLTLLRGRGLTAQDRKGTLPVALVSESYAKTAWPEESPLGKRFKWRTLSDIPWVTVVGVVSDAEMRGRREAENLRDVYFPYWQWPSPETILMMRGAVDAATLAPAAREIVRDLDSELPVFEVASLDHWISEEIRATRFTALLMGVFAGLSLLVAAVGIYSVLAYTVSQRTHEMGVRMALGAQRRDIFRMVVGQGMTLILIGLVIGLATALALTRYLESLLFGVTPTDTPTFVAVSALLMGVALAACYLPARRAAKVDPLVALRYE